MKVLPKRHKFEFEIEVNGKTKKIYNWAEVIRATKPVTLILTADHVRRSIELKGVGNTMTCSMAICTNTHIDRFPHPVIGYIDWWYGRAYVASKLSKENGLPSVCYVYEHRDGIGRMNDSLAGQKKLLAELIKNGPREIKLLPVSTGSHRSSGRSLGKPVGNRDGSRSSDRFKGAKLRTAVATLGLSLPAPAATK